LFFTADKQELDERFERERAAKNERVCRAPIGGYLTEAAINNRPISRAVAMKEFSKDEEPQSSFSV
jgi:hypothetical protein